MSMSRRGLSFSFGIMVLALGFAAPTMAGIIVTTPDAVASAFAMTDFPTDSRGDGTPVTYVDSPLGGRVEFWSQNQASPIWMTLDLNAAWFPATLGEVYKTGVNWVELILPANTRAFSFSVGASGGGTGWVEAFGDSGRGAYQGFSVGPSNTPGFGFATTDACGSISKIVVEPWEWGVGNFAISQGSCPTQVPEPGTFALFAVGLVGLAALRRVRVR
jgi:PEP-CTERM motif